MYLRLLWIPYVNKPKVGSF